MNIPELLAPVGSREALAAAVQNGADAVYMGGKMFSARQYAANFDRDELGEAVEYAHIRGVKVYITVNTLLADAELSEALDYLVFLYETGTDAIIVQDLGLARAAIRLLPGLPLHASTQMTVHNSAGAEILKQCGFARVVLARELSLMEIREIKEKTGMETEVFVHGALCVSYSGQCLMSSMIGGRSGNRGRCAQPCRLEYTLVDKKGTVLVDPNAVGVHLLSPRDLNMIRHIPDLAETGVSALKIEGRMKRPEYVATVTRIYREALDRYREAPQDYSVSAEEMKDLAQIFNRGFTTGYFFGKPGKDMMSYKRPNNRGTRLGRVTGADRAKGTVEVLLEETLRIGDGIEFWVTEGGRKGIIVSRMTVNGTHVEEARAGQKVRIQAEGKIKPGDRVFKTHDVELISRAEQSYRSPRELKKMPLSFRVVAKVGRPFEITVADREGRSFSARSDFLGQEAEKKPLTLDFLKKQLDRLGNTPFAMGSLEADLDHNVMVPVSEINDTRRRAVEGLAAARASACRRRIANRGEFKDKLKLALSKTPDETPERRRVVQAVAVSPAEMKLTVRTTSLDMLRLAVRSGADVVYFGGSNLFQNNEKIFGELEEATGICRGKGVKLVVSTPRVVREHEMKHVLPLVDFALSCSLALLAGNLGILREAVNRRLPEVFADFSLNIFNSHTLRWLSESAGVAQATVSPELTLEQIAEMARATRIRLEAVVEGHLPLMVTEYCPAGSLLGALAENKKCRRPCKPGIIRGLKDRLGLVFPMTHDEFCRTYIYNAKELSMIEDLSALAGAGISRLRVETSIEAPDRLETIIRAWRNELDRFARDPAGYHVTPGIKEKISAMSPAGLTKGHFYRGVE